MHIVYIINYEECEECKQDRQHKISKQHGDF